MIALNFLNSGVRDFGFTVFRSKEPLGPDEKVEDDCLGFRLPKEKGDKDDWPRWAVRFSKKDGFEEIEVQSSDNPYLTTRAIANSFLNHAKNQPELNVVEEDDWIYPNKVVFDVERTESGIRQVTLEPYFLARTDSYGLICSFRFRTDDPTDRSRAAQQGSLSLDKNGKSNRKKLVDTADFLGRFLKANDSLISGVQIGDKEFSFGPKFEILEPVSLPAPVYIAANGQRGSSAFGLLNRAGPAKPLDAAPCFCFCFSEEDREISRRVYRGLRGELAGGFKGLHSTYGFDLSAENVSSVSISKWDLEELAESAEQIKEGCGDDLPFAIVALPREADNDDQIYWNVKASFLRAGIHSQLIQRNTISSPKTFEYSLPNLALNIFAKCGGTPWLSKTEGEPALVVGISQAIQKDEDGNVSRVFGYAVVTDTSGAFHGMKFLADSNKATDYGKAIIDRLQQLLEESKSNYNRCVLHASFALRKDEVKAIQDAARKVSEKNFKVVAVQLSDSKKWTGFDTEDPLMVPANGTLVQLSYRESLAWLVSTAHGVNSGRPNRPVFAKRLFPVKSTEEVLTQSLREASGLSGLSWRNFGETSLPVTIIYAKRIARALAKCPQLHEILASEDFDWPWFI